MTVSPNVSIPESELVVRASRAGGAGGQHVNKTSTRIEVVWNIRTSNAITEEQRDRLLARLAPRLSSEGEIRIVASEMRSQRQNRERALERLHEVVSWALEVPKTRKRTKPTRASKEARLASKRRRSERKTNRRVAADE
jgi:ribosome-associated protein